MLVGSGCPKLSPFYALYPQTTARLDLAERTNLPVADIQEPETILTE